MPFRLTRSAGLWRRTLMVRRLCLVVILLVAALVLRMASQGLPDRWVRALSESLSSDGAGGVHLEDVTFGLRRGIRIGLVRVQADPSDPAFLELRDARVRLRWHWGFPSPQWVREVDLHRVVLHALPREHDGERRPVLPEFGPVRIRCESAEILGTLFRDVSAEVLSRGTRFEIERLECDLSPPRHPAEALFAEFSFGVGDRSVRGAVHGELDPLRLVPLLQACGLEGTAEIVERFEFPATPVAIRLRLDYAPAEARRRAELALSAGASVYRNVPLMSARAALTAQGREAWEEVRLDQLLLERPEGTARGTVRFDLQGHGLEFAATSTFDPRHFTGLLGLFREASWVDWTFGPPTELVASGYYGSSRSERETAIEARVRMPSLHYQLQRARGVEVEFSVTPGRCSIARASAQAYGGTLEARGDLFWSKEDPTRFSVSADLRGAHLGSFLKSWMLRSADEAGSLDLGLELRGDFQEQARERLKGRGDVRIRGARLYRMPLFAGFTDFMARNVPGVDFVLSQSDLNAGFSVGDDRIGFDLLQIEGGVFSIAGSGQYAFKDQLDIGVRVHLLKQRTWLGRVLRVALFPVSKLFELELTGSLENPKWSPAALTLRGRRDALPKRRESGSRPEREELPR